MTNTKSDRAKDGATAQEKSETPEVGAGTSPSGDHNDDRTQLYADDELRGIDSRRTGTKALDACSWREMARACHVQPGVGDE
jgi:hypothetical protein